MSIFGAVLAKVLADRKGLPPDISNRFLVTGYVVGSVASPLASAFVSERLAQQEADKLATATPTSPPTTPPPGQPPGTGQPPPATAVIAKDYRGKLYSEVEKELKDQKIDVLSLSISDSNSNYGKGMIIDQFKPDREPLEEGTLLIPGDTVVFAVKSDEKLIDVPLVEGLTPEEAKKAIETKGFLFIQREEVRAQRWLDGGIWEQMTARSGPIVFDQEPEAGIKAALGSTVTVYVLPKKGAVPVPVK